MFFNKLFFSIGIVMLIGCEPSVVFFVPQPKDVEARATFDPLYRGKFLCDSDSAYVFVKSNCVFKEREVKVETTLDALDTIPGIRIENNMLFIEESNLYFPFDLNNDTIKADVMLRDTLFNVGEGVLKYYRGHQILNIPKGKDKWEVWILSLDHYFNLSLAKAEIPEDLQSLEHVTFVEDLSTDEYPQIRLNPSLVEFKKILDNEMLFEECDYYMRLETPTEI